MMKDINRGHGIDSLYELNGIKSKRLSSYDRSGGNHDWMDLEPGKRGAFADISGAGIIRHI